MFFFVVIFRYTSKFSQYATDHNEEVQKLMGSLAYLRVGLKNSPYSQLLSESVWDDACKTFVELVELKNIDS